MTDIERAVEAMRTRTTGDDHIASITRLVEAARAVLVTAQMFPTPEQRELKAALDETLDDDTSDPPLSYPWAKFCVSVIDTSTGREDVEYFEGRGQVKEALDGGMIMLSLDDQRAMLSHLPTKPGEKNTRDLYSGYVVTIERLKEDVE